MIATASIGGAISPAGPYLADALEAGLDIVSGAHDRLSDNALLKSIAEVKGRRLIDVRSPPPGLLVGTGRRRTGKRLLTVGTDCALGKKYTALAVTKAFRGRGLDADFRATGQTGIMIAGSGIPIDSVVSDFVAGAAEALSPDADPAHWDVIEGQGSLFHPSYAGVSLGLLHGSQLMFSFLHALGTREHTGAFPNISAVLWRAVEGTTAGRLTTASSCGGACRSILRA